MAWRLAFLLALLLPELALEPSRGGLPPALTHPLGTDALGRDALLRLALAGARSLGWASGTAVLALLLGLGLAGPGRRGAAAWSALRSLPPLLFLIPLAASAGRLGFLALGGLLGVMLAPHLEPALRSRVDAFRTSPAWAAERLLGAPPAATARRWAPWAWAQVAGLFPGVWLSALWGEATLGALGLGPGPARDTLGRILAEELPLLGAAPTPLGLAAFAAVLLLAAVGTPRKGP